MTETTRMIVRETGGPDVLQRETVTLDAPRDGEVRIRQEAIGLNFIDTYIRTGLYPAKLPVVPGFEGAGVIEAVGKDVSHLKAGDRVAYCAVQGTYASHLNAPASQLVKLPDSISSEEAAAVMLKGLTAWMLLFEIKRVMPGDTLLGLGCCRRSRVDTRAVGEGARRSCYRGCLDRRESCTGP